MKHRISIKVTEYGYVDIEAPKDMPSIELKRLAYEQVKKGNMIYNKLETKITH